MLRHVTVIGGVLGFFFLKIINHSQIKRYSKITLTGKLEEPKTHVDE